MTRHRAEGGRPNRPIGLGDFGVDAGMVNPPPTALPIVVADAPQAFVKFLGEGDDRVPLSFSTIDEIERAGCHWAVAYPATKRPRGVKDDAVIFIARLTDDPNDIRVFGRAIGTRHVPGRDDATPADIARLTAHVPAAWLWDSRSTRFSERGAVAGLVGHEGGGVLRGDQPRIIRALKRRTGDHAMTSATTKPEI